MVDEISKGENLIRILWFKVWVFRRILFININKSNKSIIRFGVVGICIKDFFLDFVRLLFCY